MATNARAFNGTTAKITLAQGTVGVYGPGTAFALIFPTATGAPQTALSTGSANAAGFMLQADTKVYCRTDGTEVHGSALMSASNWYAISASKATGTTTPRLHVYDCTAGTWTHENASGTRPNSSTPTTRNALGVNSAGTGAFFTGTIQLAAFWSSVLDDTATAALISLSAVIAAAPNALWILDQASTAIPVPDYTGNGADETALTGTTVSSVTIPNFDMTYPSANAPFSYLGGGYYPSEG